MQFKNPFHHDQPDVAVDIGTATTRVTTSKGDRQWTVPSSGDWEPALAHGVIINVDAAAEALRPIFTQLHAEGIKNLRVLACAPSDTSTDEREAVIETCYRAGAGAVALIPEPVAAAIGDGLRYDATEPALLVDIGEGVTDCAIVREGRLTGAFARRIACADLRDAVASAVYRWSGLEITPDEARDLLMALGVGRPDFGPDGLPRLRALPLPRGSRREIPAGVLHEGLEPVVTAIVDTVKTLVDGLPHLREDLHGSPVRLSGGGALIPGFAERIQEATGLTVRPTRRALDSVVRGAKQLLPVAALHDLWRHVKRNPTTGR